MRGRLLYLSESPFKILAKGFCRGHIGLSQWNYHHSSNDVELPSLLIWSYDDFLLQTQSVSSCDRERYKSPIRAVSLIPLLSSLSHPFSSGSQNSRTLCQSQAPTVQIKPNHHAHLPSLLSTLPTRPCPHLPLLPRPRRRPRRSRRSRTGGRPQPRPSCPPRSRLGRCSRSSRPSRLKPTVLPDCWRSMRHQWEPQVQLQFVEYCESTLP